MVEMGPEPKAGRLMEVDPDKKEITIYDAASQSFKSIPYQPVEEVRNVSIRDPRAQEKFPKETVELLDPALLMTLMR